MGPQKPLVGVVPPWSTNADALKRALGLQDILDGFSGPAIVEERKAKARHKLQIGSWDSDIIDLDLLDPYLIASNKLTRNDCNHFAIILQILKPFHRLAKQPQYSITENQLC